MAFRTASTLLVLCLAPAQTRADEPHPVTQQTVASLPAVDLVMTRATGKAMDFAQQAKEMQRLVVQRQEESKAMLADSKKKYEQSLRKQADINKVIMEENTGLNMSIAKQRLSNEKLLNETDALQKGNAVLRKTLTAIQQKVVAAREFLVESMKVTDDSKAAELEVLVPTTPPPSLDHFLSVAVNDQKDAGIAGAPSLLQVSSHLRRRKDGEPQEFVQVLSRSLAEIAEAQKEGEVQLKASYMANLDASQKRHEELLHVQDMLNGTLAALRQQGAALAAAKSHLESTKLDLENRLNGLRKFAAKVDEASKAALSIPVEEEAAQKRAPTAQKAQKAPKAQKGASLLGVNADVKAKEAHAKSKVAPAAPKQPAGAAPAAAKAVPVAALSRTASGGVAAAASALSSKSSSAADALKRAEQAVQKASAAEAIAQKVTQSARMEGKVSAPAKASTPKVIAAESKAAAKAPAAPKVQEASAVPAKPAQQAKAASPAPKKAKKAQETTSTVQSWRSWFGSWR